MTTSAPRIDSRLVAALSRLDDQSRPIAETNRRLGELAELLGFSRPSYEQVRVIVHDIRRRKRDPSVGEVLLDISFRARPPTALLDHLSGVGVSRLGS